MDCRVDSKPTNSPMGRSASMHPGLDGGPVPRQATCFDTIPSPLGPVLWVCMNLALPSNPDSVFSIEDSEKKECMKKECSMVMLLLCTVALVSATPETAAQTPTSQISPEWQALGWTLPKSYSPDQIALFQGSMLPGERGRLRRRHQVKKPLAPWLASFWSKADRKEAWHRHGI